MQIWPKLAFLENANFSAAKFKSAVSSIIVGDFPPSSKRQGTRFLAAEAATRRPFSVEPVKAMMSKGLAVMAMATYTPPSMQTKAEESRYLTQRRFKILEHAGDISEGLIMQQFPAAIAWINGLKVVESGKFQDPTIKATPRGSFTTLLVAYISKAGVSRCSSLLHSFKCSIACLIPFSTMRSSAYQLMNPLRPRSCSSASSKSFLNNFIPLRRFSNWPFL